MAQQDDAQLESICDEITALIRTKVLSAIKAKYPGIEISVA